MATVEPSETLLASPSDLADRYDARTLAELASDDNSPADEQQLSANRKILAALYSAQGRVLSYLLRADRYTAEDLANLDGPSRSLVAELICVVAYSALWRRKAHASDDVAANAAKLAREDASESIEALHSGKVILNVAATRQAGLPKTDTISRAEIDTNWSLVVDVARHGRFYPRRRSYGNR